MGLITDRLGRGIDHRLMTDQTRNLLESFHSTAGIKKFDQLQKHMPVELLDRLRAFDV